jgi:hypothetical protein
MKQQYSLTSIWYWGLNSIGFIVATFGTVQAIVPNFQPASPVNTPPQRVQEPFNLSFNLYKPTNQLNNPNHKNFQLNLLPIPSAESQKCQVFSCLPPNPFRNNSLNIQLDNSQNENLSQFSKNVNCHSELAKNFKVETYAPSVLGCTSFSITVPQDENLQQSNYSYTSSNIKSYKFDKLDKIKKFASLNLDSPLNNTNQIIPLIPKAKTPTVTSKTQTNSGIFSHTYEVVSTSQPKTPEVTVKKIPLTVADAIHLTLADGAAKSAYLEKITQTELAVAENKSLSSSYKWNETSNIKQPNQIDIKLSLTKNTDKKIVRLNELIQRQDSRNALNSKITNVILTYRKLQQAQEKVKIAELSLKNAEDALVNLTNYRVALLAARNEVEARRLELSSILELNKKIQIVASEIPIIQTASLDLNNLQQIALQHQPNYLRNQMNFEISKLRQENEAITGNTLKNTASQLDTHLKNSINYINSIYSQIEGVKQATKLSEQQLRIEQVKSKLGKSSQSQLINKINELSLARNKELEVNIKYLNALTNLDQLLGTTLNTWEISI